jgi:DNA polymerase-4
MVRTILHLDLDAFFCAVEELNNPSLSGKPFAVGGRPNSRGVVASCSYPARLFGVHSAMPMGRALRLCPELLIVSPRFHEYSRQSQLVMDRLFQITPLIEQVSIDEAFLDVSENDISGIDIARSLQMSINQELQLPCSIGVASNKLVAKIANDVGKASARGKTPPNAITLVPAGEEQAFLAPLPVQRLWGVGPKTAQTLASVGITNIGELASFPEKVLQRIFGKNGYFLSIHARGIDEGSIITSRETKSISQEVTFAVDITDRDELFRTMRTQSEQVGKKLRADHLVGSTIKIKLRWSNFTTITRQSKLAMPTDLDSEIAQAALRLFEKNWVPGKPVRLIGVGVSGLSTSFHQLSLWDQTLPAKHEKERNLKKALDELHSKFGDTSIQTASKIKSSQSH